MDSIIICILKTSKSMLPVQISPLRSQLFYLTTLSFPLAISQRHLKLILDLSLKLDYPICLLSMKETTYHPVQKQEIWTSFYFLPLSIPFTFTSAPFPFILPQPVPTSPFPLPLFPCGPSPFPFWRNYCSLPPLVWGLPTPHSSNSDLVKHKYDYTTLSHKSLLVSSLCYNKQ